MPELPEIETIKNDLSSRLCGITIAEVTFSADPKLRILRRFPSQAKFVHSLRGTVIRGLRRRAKYLIFDLPHDRMLVVHLGMSGRLLLTRAGSPPDRYLQATLHLTNGYELRFIDPRKFGELFLLGASLESPLDLEGLGPEPLGEEFTVSYLAGRVGSSNRAIKVLLMDQKAIAGIGNIYSDEILFRARVHPAKPAATLDRREIGRLYREIRAVLGEAISRRGTTASDQRYRDGLGKAGNFQTILKVYQRAGRPCPRCGAVIVAKRLGGRTASFCPHCQG
jgi:formamidopyrimidine-DNA glycosylase